MGKEIWGWKNVDDEARYLMDRPGNNTHHSQVYWIGQTQPPSTNPAAKQAGKLFLCDKEEGMGLVSIDSALPLHLCSSCYSCIFLPLQSLCKCCLCSLSLFLTIGRSTTKQSMLFKSNKWTDFLKMKHFMQTNTLKIDIYIAALAGVGMNSQEHYLIGLFMNSQLPLQDHPSHSWNPKSLLHN